MNRKRNNLRALFEFTSTERRRMLILLACIFFLSIVQVIIKKSYKGKPIISGKDRYRLLQLLKDEPDQLVFDMDYFDPNQVTIQDLLSMGWPQRASQTLINFRNSGFEFRSAEDLKKVVGIDEDFFKVIQPWIKGLSNKKSTPAYLNSNLSTQSPKVLVMRSFDPNKISAKELINMGWPAKPAYTLVSYREKIMPFELKSDLKVVNGLSDSLYQVITPFILLPDSIRQEHKESVDKELIAKSTFTPKYYPRDTININTADTIELRKLRGIGPYYAKVITWYRDRLGGFYDESQLYGIPKLDSALIDSILPYITLDATYKKLNINDESFKRLVAHPYLQYQSVIELKNYFKKRPQRDYLEVYLKKSTINSDTLSLLTPYLILEE